MNTQPKRTAIEQFWIELMNKYPAVGSDMLAEFMDCKLLEYKHIRDAMYFRGNIYNNGISADKYIYDTFGDSSSNIQNKSKS